MRYKVHKPTQTHLIINFRACKRVELRSHRCLIVRQTSIGLLDERNFAVNTRLDLARRWRFVSVLVDIWRRLGQAGRYY